MSGESDLPHSPIMEGASNKKVASFLHGMVKGLMKDITPTEAELLALEPATNWLVERLLNYRSYDDNVLWEGKQVFVDVRKGGSVARKTAIHPINDLDLVVTMSLDIIGPDGGDVPLLTTFDHVMGALSMGSESCERIPPVSYDGSSDVTLMYRIRLRDVKKHGNFSTFVVRWQRHSFGVCFAEIWDDRMTNFDLVPMWAKDGKQYLTSRFSHSQEANPAALSNLTEEVRADETLLMNIRLFKMWNERHARGGGQRPFASFELEGAIIILWSHDEVRAAENDALRVVLLFRGLKAVLGSQYRVPGLSDDRGAYVLVGRGNESWSVEDVRRLVHESSMLLDGAYFTVNDPRRAEEAWKHVLLVESVKTTFVVEPFSSKRENTRLDGSDDEPLLHAAVLNDETFEEFKNLLTQVHNSKHNTNDINATDVRGRTVIFLAAGRGRHDLVGLLLDEGANPWLCDSMGQDALHRSAMSRSVPCMILILEHVLSSVLLNAEEKRKRLALALRVAVHVPQREAVKILLEHGASPMMSVNGAAHSWYLLFAAGRPIHVSIVKMLLDHGAVVDSHSCGLAAMRGDIHILTELVRQCNNVPLSELLWKALITSVQLGYDDVVRWILKQDGSLGRSPEKLRVLVQIACTWGFNKVLAILLAEGAVVDDASLILTTVMGHYGALRALYFTSGRILSSLSASTALSVDRCARERGYEDCAALFLNFAMQAVEAEKFVEYLAASDRGDVAWKDFPCGRIPFIGLQMLLASREAGASLDQKIQRFVTEADARRLHLFGFCVAHPHTEEVLVCGACSQLHLLCSQCEIPQSDDHVWDRVKSATNGPMFDLILSLDTFPNTLARLGCIKGLRRLLEDDKNMEEKSRRIVLLQLDILNADANHLVKPFESASDLIDPLALTAVKEGKCTSTGQFQDQFFYECITCGLTRRFGCCEVCRWKCHADHDVVIVPRFGEFECDCPTLPHRQCSARQKSESSNSGK